MDKRINRLYLSMGLVGLLAAAACTNYPGPVGPLRTEAQSVKLGAAKSVRVEIHMGAGELKVGGSAPDLLDADFTYNVPDWKPRVEYDVSNGEGTLTVEQPHATHTGGHDTRYTWDLHLSDKVPLSISVEQGAGRTELNLATLSLTSVDVRIGAGETIVDLTGDYKNDVTARIRGGVGKATVKLPRDVGVRAVARGGIGAINAHDLIKEGGAYVNDAYGKSPVTVRVEVEGGVGEINLVLAGPPPAV
jgi:hypothetical protein